MSERRSNFRGAAGARRSSQFAAGKRWRKRVPRSGHATWNPPKGRGDPVEFLRQGDRELNPRLLPLRYARMAASAFAFLRGSAGLMARDLAAGPSTGIRAQLCGDAHLSNFGVFSTPERELVFDVVDFDETLPGPFEWDLKRLAVSLVLAGPIVGLRPRECREIARLAVQSYRRLIEELARQPYLRIWYFHLDEDEVRAHVRRCARRQIQQEEQASVRKAEESPLPRFVKGEGGRFRIVDAPPVVTHTGSAKEVGEALAFFEAYLPSLPEVPRALVERYRVVDVAQKIVGVGSVGTDCRVLLLSGDDDVEDPLLLQLKQAQRSALEPFLGASLTSNPAERVVTGQRAIQESADAFLGTSSLDGRHYYVRSLNAMKFSPVPEQMSPKGLRGHASLSGAALARAHARTGSAATIAGYLGKSSAFDEAISDFAMAYSVQVHQDYSALLRAIRRGRLPGTSIG